MARRRRTLLGTRRPVTSTPVPAGEARPRDEASDAVEASAEAVEAAPEAELPGAAEPRDTPEADEAVVEASPDAAEDAADAAQASDAAEERDAEASHTSEEHDAAEEHAAAEASDPAEEPAVAPDTAQEPAEAADAGETAEDAEDAEDADTVADTGADPEDASEAHANAEAADAGATPEGGSDWEAWRTAGMEAALHGIGDEFDDFGDPPPTEEVSTALFEDYTTPFDGSVHVPEPPPVPGLGDRFTPPPVQRTPVGKHQTENRPSYLAEPTPSPAPQRTRDFTTYEEELRRLREADAPAQSGIPAPLLALAGVAVVGLAALVIGVVSMLPSGSGDAPDLTSEGIVRKHVEVRADMRQAPGFIGVDTDVLRPQFDDDAGEDLADDDDAGTSTTSDEAVPGTSAPTPTTTTRPRARKRASTPPPEAALGTLRIRSNRRVLVYLNDRAVGYTPQDREVAPGSYRVSAMLPGQPESRQDLDVQLSKGGDVQGVDFRF